jgi:hypothetical protein
MLCITLSDPAHTNVWVRILEGMEGRRKKLQRKMRWNGKAGRGNGRKKKDGRGRREKRKRKGRGEGITEMIQRRGKGVEEKNERKEMKKSIKSGGGRGNE